MTFLYEILPTRLSEIDVQKSEIPKIISTNLNKKFSIRPYQNEAFWRFIAFYENNFKGKQKPPYHINFNMATGSGKTFIMAGLILYLYEKGFRNFLFFVDSANIIEKTKENFLNGLSSKYLFAKNLYNNDKKEIKIKEVKNFEDVDNKSINICFTTIQKLHSDLTKTKENSLTIEDFKENKIALIADEAHHINADTKNGNQKTSDIIPTWENTVINILKHNYSNILLEFTATLDFDNQDIKLKYLDKIIFKYDLKQFRLGGYSKEINLLRSRLEQNDRILQAVILSQYKQEVAAKYGINLKPVILFKAKRTIKESERNKKKFHALIENLTASQIQNIENTSAVPVIQKAFNFFNENNISCEILSDRLKSNFDERKCLSANNDAEKEQNQIILNSLEDLNNPIRAIFAVQKLNEGWDVLNLFDIVRLYEGRDSNNNRPGKTTIAEAQLIGRGARYFPFKILKQQDLYTRKYDKDLTNELRILEELYYHTQEDSRYISELKTALIETGIYEDDNDLIQKNLILKDSFKKTNFYKKGFVLLNKKIPKKYDDVKSITDLALSKKNIEFELHSGAGDIITAFSDNNQTKNIIKTKQKNIELKNIQKHIIKRALADNPFFRFDNIHKYFPNINSTSKFIEKKEYLNALEITFKGTEKRLQKISNKDLYLAISKILKQIEDEIKNNSTDYQGTKDFYYKSIQEVFKDKTLKINKNDERINGQEEFLKDKKLYVFNANYGTPEEKAFVKMFEKKYKHLKKNFKDIFLIRNERVIKIFNFKDGQAFEPDFILFITQKEDEQITYQVFIETKVTGYVSKDKCKEDFLKKIRDNKKTIDILTHKYRITGAHFNDVVNETEFNPNN